VGSVAGVGGAGGAACEDAAGSACSAAGATVPAPAAAAGAPLRVFDRWPKLSALPTTALAQRTVSLALVQAALLTGTREERLAQRLVPL